MADPQCPFCRDNSPLVISSGSQQVQGSYFGFSSYALQLEDAHTSAQAYRTFGVNLTPQMRLDLEDDPQAQTSHRHRFILICQMGAKLIGLDICPSHSKSVHVFPLLLALRSSNNDIKGYIAHPFLRGSVSFDPTTKSSQRDCYLASPGWGQGSGIVSSYAAALALIDGYKRLTGNSPGQIKGMNAVSPPRNALRLLYCIFHLQECSNNHGSTDPSVHPCAI